MLTIKNIPIEKLVPNAEQPRKEMENKFSTIESLALNIAEHGLLNPITVKELPSGNYLIVAGERRYRACVYLGFEKVGCTVIDTDKVDIVAVAENLARKDLTEVEKAEAIAKIRTQYETNVALAKDLGVSEGYIRKLIKVNNLSDKEKQDITDGKTTAHEAVKQQDTSPKEKPKKEHDNPKEESDEKPSIKTEDNEFCIPEKPDIKDVTKRILELAAKMEQLTERYNSIESTVYADKNQLDEDFKILMDKYQDVYNEICHAEYYVLKLAAKDYLEAKGE